MSILSSDPFACHKCGTPYSVTDRIGRKDTCRKCDADLHCCLNCRHYNKHVHNECNENQAEWVRDKDRSNYCDYFDPKRGGSSGAGKSSTEEARSRFEDLFRK